MPFKFWKKEKPEKGGPAKPESETKVVPAAETPAAPEAKPAAATIEAPSPAPAVVAPTAPKPPPDAAEIEAAISGAHAGLVDLALTIPATKGVFTKRVAAFPGGTEAFVDAYKTSSFRAVTRVLVDWLGFRAPAEVDPEAFLKDVNLRLSSFKLSVKMSDLTWLDEELNLRKARLNLDGQEKVVRFKDARDFVRGINELIASRKIMFLELETWDEDFAFMLVRDPKWDKLAATELVVVKAPQTAVGGECGECGAPVGQNWHDCLSCGAVFGSD